MDVVTAGNEELETALIVCVVLMVVLCGLAVYLWLVWRKTVKMNKVLDHTEYFLDIEEDDAGDGEDDTLHGGMHAVNADLFHPVVSVDTSAARMIQRELQEQRKLSLESDERTQEPGDGDGSRA